MDEKTRLGWAIHEEEVESFSTYKTLLKFLECRMTSLKAHKTLTQPTSSESLSKNKKGTNNGNNVNYNKQINANMAQAAPTKKANGKSKKQRQFKGVAVQRNEITELHKNL